jgi:hypothetical protein
MRIGLISLRYGPIAECCEHGNDSSGSIKCWKCPDQLSEVAQEGLCSIVLVSSLLYFVLLEINLHT